MVASPVYSAFPSREFLEWLAVPAPSPHKAITRFPGSLCAACAKMTNGGNQITKEFQKAIELEIQGSDNYAVTLSAAR